ncbi:restriction endonuclease subunit S [Lactobacillus sp. B4007]|nr:restriction endonuclease subunit S [Lactobacillus sp. B4007]
MYLVESPRVKKELWKRTLHIAFPKKINKNEISKITICTSSDIGEQQKIGGLFAKLDRLLDLQQQKLDQLELLKKALLQKLFPKQDAKIPELRFKGFVEEWGDFVLGKIAKFLNGRAYKQSELLEKGKYPVLRVGNFYTNDSWYYSNLQLPEKYYAKKGDLLYTWSATFGPHIWNGSTVIYHYHIWKIELSSLLNKEFTYQLLLEDRSKLLNNTNGSTMIHLTKSEMESKLVKIPNIAEQQKIGNLLAKIDRLIELENKKFSNLKLVKKSLLQNMFVE